MNTKEIVNELSDKTANMVSALIFSNAHRIYDDLRKMTQEEKKVAQIVLKPEIKVFMDTDGFIDIEANIQWKYELKRSDRIESVHIDPLQMNLPLGDDEIEE